jgi:hypothetical protein
MRSTMFAAAVCLSFAMTDCREAPAPVTSNQSALGGECCAEGEEDTPSGCCPASQIGPDQICCESGCPDGESLGSDCGCQVACDPVDTTCPPGMEFDLTTCDCIDVGPPGPSCPYCSITQTCIDGQCVNLCTDMNDCNAGETCHNGYCVNECGPMGECPSGFTCDGVRCQPPCGPTCTACDPQTGLCAGCEGDGDCGGGSTCVNGACVQPPPGGGCNEPCRFPLTCQNGVCAPAGGSGGGCQSDLDCLSGFTCSGGHCTSTTMSCSPPPAVDCLPGSTCVVPPGSSTGYCFTQACEDACNAAGNTCGLQPMPSGPPCCCVGASLNCMVLCGLVPPPAHADGGVTDSGAPYTDGGVTTADAAFPPAPPGF